MLDELHIQNVALIRDATFAPSPGLTVVTGETGTGKTALINALALLVGGRGAAGLVREGAEELTVEGRFFFDDVPEGTVAVRRVSTQGRSRASIDGSLVSVGELATQVGTSVDLCGQHEHQRLLSADYQRALLDAWGGVTIKEPLEAYKRCYAQVAAAKAELERLYALAESDSVALDRARFALDQIDEVDPAPGEYEALLEQLPRLEHAETLVSEATLAKRGITGQGGTLEHLDETLGALDRIAAIDDRAKSYANTVRDAYFQLEDVGRELGSYCDTLDFPQEELAEAQTRLAAMQGLMRGFGPRMEDVFALRDQSRALLAEYEGVGSLIEQAEAAYDQAENTLASAAVALRKAREAVLPRFVAEVDAQLAKLEMASAHLKGELRDVPREAWSEWGPHTFELLFASGEQVGAQKLGKIASGGEMSRVALALKVVLGATDEVDTLVFDEIDAGVGGAVARSLAAVLQDLAKTHQVIVITHLPQVAVVGSVHYVVTKTQGEIPETHLQRLDEEGRVSEIARMLAGAVNEISCAHARELLGQL